MATGKRRQYPLLLPVPLASIIALEQSSLLYSSGLFFTRTKTRLTDQMKCVLKKDADSPAGGSGSNRYRKFLISANYIITDNTFDGSKIENVRVRNLRIGVR